MTFSRGNGFTMVYPTTLQRCRCKSCSGRPSKTRLGVQGFPHGCSGCQPWILKIDAVNRSYFVRSCWMILKAVLVVLLGLQMAHVFPIHQEQQWQTLPSKSNVRSGPRTSSQFPKQLKRAQWCTILAGSLLVPLGDSMFGRGSAVSPQLTWPNGRGAAIDSCSFRGGSATLLWSPSRLAMRPTNCHWKRWIQLPKSQRRRSLNIWLDFLMVMAVWQ